MTLALNLRVRTETYEGSGEWRERTCRKEIRPAEAAILICDMWDRHWCRSATRRGDALAHKMASVIDVARSQGVQIIHAPSECMKFYQETPQRQRLRNLPRVDPPPTLLSTAEPPLPIDDSDGGCDDTPSCPVFKAWSRQHPAIGIAEPDAISDDGEEVYNLLRAHGIGYLLIMGVHTNMCVLKRSFAIRAMTRRGISCVLVRDLTDSLYNPKMPPFVGHDEGTELVVQHIEKYWCPSVLSEDLVRKLLASLRGIFGATKSLTTRNGPVTMCGNPSCEQAVAQLEK